MHFLTNHQANQQIWGKASYPPYAHFFVFFQNSKFLTFINFFFIFMNMRSYGSKNFKRLLLPQFQFIFNLFNSSYRFYSFFSQTFFNVPCGSPHKNYLVGCSNLKLNFLEAWNLSLWPMEKFQNATPPTVWFFFNRTEMCKVFTSHTR